MSETPPVSARKPPLQMAAAKRSGARWQPALQQLSLSDAVLRWRVGLAALLVSALRSELLYGRHLQSAAPMELPHDSLSESVLGERPA